MAGKLNRRDGGCHTARLADHDLVDPAGDVLEVIALHQRRNAASDLHVLNSARQLSSRFGESLAILLRGETRDFVAVLLEQRSCT